MEIHVTEGRTPVKCKAYQTSRAEREATIKIVNEWKRTSIATETRFPDANPIILVSQKGGKKRFVLNYRHLNKQTKKEYYSLPNIKDLLESLCKGKLFVQLDLASRYF